MKVPFTWKFTGWFVIGWSAEFPVGEVRPLRYFGEYLVAYRDESGELRVLSGHCRHLGAHIGHGGKVVGDCVECPFHGWRWGPDGTNRYIPYQPDRPQPRAEAAGLPGPGAVRLRVRLASTRRQGTAVGAAGPVPQIPAVRHRPERVLPAVPRVFESCRARAGASADRRRERARQRALPLRARRHGHARCASTGRRSTRNGGSSPAGRMCVATIRTRWRCTFTATSPGSASRSARSRGRRTTA